MTAAPATHQYRAFAVEGEPGAEGVGDGICAPPHCGLKYLVEGGVVANRSVAIVRHRRRIPRTTTGGRHRRWY